MNNSNLEVTYTYIILSWLGHTMPVCIITYSRYKNSSQLSFGQSNLMMKFFTAIAFAAAFVALACSQSPVDTKCVEQYCASIFGACTKDAKCMETVGCIDKCWKAWDKDPSPQKFTVQNCTNNCVYTYADDTFVKTLTCLDTNKCIKLPAIPSTCKGPDNVKFQKNISLAELAGTFWTLRGYNPVYDCYPCQKDTISSSTYTASFQAYLVDGGLKLVQENGTIVDNSPKPGFAVTIQMGVPISMIFWPFDRIDDAMGNRYYLIYYCGNSNQWNYEGAFVLSKATMISESAVAAIRSSYQMSVGIDFDRMCSPTTTNCPNNRN